MLTDSATAPPLPPPPEPGQRVPRPPRGRGQRILLTAALLVPLITVIALLVVFQPLADAAGGCGGG